MVDPLISKILNRAKTGRQDARARVNQLTFDPFQQQYPPAFLTEARQLADEVVALEAKLDVMVPKDLEAAFNQAVNSGNIELVRKAARTITDGLGRRAQEA